MGTSTRELGFVSPCSIDLASIVEKETGVAWGAQIAGVFVRRPERAWLQTDPTVIYGVAMTTTNLKRRPCETPEPYNTYAIHGLPPTPSRCPVRPPYVPFLLLLMARRCILRG